MEAILEAINIDDINSVVQILSTNQDVDLNMNADRPSREIPLQAAARKYNKEVLDSLLCHGADINIKDDDGTSALDFLVWDNDYEHSLPIIEFLVSKGADIEKAFHHAFYEDKFEIVRILIRKYNKKVAMTWDYLKYTIGNQRDFDILEYFVGAPDYEFNKLSICFQEYAYKMLNQFMEKKSWESAMRYILLHYYSTIDNQHSLGGLVDNKIGIIETILENLTDFSFVDSSGTKFVDAIFNKCLDPELLKQLDGNVIKKLLEAGADENTLNETLYYYLDTDGSDKDITKKYIETGVDLNKLVNHNDKEMRLCDAVFLTSALYGHFDVMEDMMARGADIGCILVSKEIDQMFSDYHVDRVHFVFDKLHANGILKDKRTKIGPNSEPLVDFFKSHGKEEVLVKIGLLAEPPRGLTVTHSGVSCCVSWDSVPGPEDIPVTGYLIECRRQYRNEGWEEVGTLEGQKTLKFKISGVENNDEVVFRVSPQNEQEPVTVYQLEYQRQYRNGGWEEVGTLEGQESSKFKISGLENNDEVMFRVSARNAYGLSAPLEEPDFQKVLVLPGPPGRPKHEVTGEDIIITWAPPVSGGYRFLTKYRVEGRDEDQDWRILGTIANGREKQWEQKMEIFDFKRLNFDSVRVIAVNEDGESQPSDPSFACFEFGCY